MSTKPAWAEDKPSEQQKQPLPVVKEEVAEPVIEQAAIVAPAEKDEPSVEEEVEGNAFWDLPPVSCEDVDGLFKSEEPTILEMGWMGWFELIRNGDLKRAFRFSDYFDDIISSGKLTTIEQAMLYARDVIGVLQSFYTNGTVGDSFENCMLAYYGLEEKVFIERYGEKLCGMYRTSWVMGQAFAIRKVKQSLYDKASSGSLDAQKTVLRSVGELEDENVKGLRGNLSFVIDSDDANA